MVPVWLLGPVVLGLTTAGPVPTAKPTTARKVCHLERFVPVSPREMEAFKKAKDALEKKLQLKVSRCSARLFPRTWDLRQLPAWERPMALQAELALTLEVLGTVTDPALEDVLEQPLHTLYHIHTKVQACVSPPTHPMTRGQLLSPVSPQESPGCLQASVTFNLFRLLTQDLRYVASPEL
ncbi:interferon lambda-1 [Octodon degus]|uniref:Interferon lambda-1 n=1 Tax=Octodon degus TaxID=10160 RepID=A0A6P3F221_OCTDE|nr:interferon lambda-1 [Octodon degus]